MAASWLKDAVFYEIYPQSFRDTNGDGIGDIPGIIEKLDYVKSIGCNALWINPWYDSPFVDAGYDVRDFYKIAPRYGTMADAEELLRVAHEKGIHVLIDLVPGHTSEEHPWFLKSAEEHPCEEYADRYIWTDSAFTRGDGMPFIGGEKPRDATYIINFFKCQPALNYGFRKINEPNWQMPIDAPAALATREAMKDIMRFWLDKGADGFRVDMADSLVKNDGEEKLGTMEVWKDIAGTIHGEYPEMALVSEWNNPQCALNCGFDMDFYLDWYGNGYSRLIRYYQLDKKGQIIKDESYFNAHSEEDITGFLEEYQKKVAGTEDKGMWCLITGNHDCKRPSFNLNDKERKLAYTFLLTMPGAPFIYYGDEIGIQDRWVPTKEGGYHRTGTRTPMQWNEGENLGFSSASADQLYLPVDPNPGNSIVALQETDSDSMLNHIRRVLAVRKEYADLGNYSPFKPYYVEKGDRLFAYKRGDMLLAVNPGLEQKKLALDGAYEVVFTFGEAEVAGKKLSVGAQSFVILQPVK